MNEWVRGWLEGQETRRIPFRVVIPEKDTEERIVRPAATDGCSCGAQYWRGGQRSKGRGVKGAHQDAESLSLEDPCRSLAPREAICAADYHLIKVRRGELCADSRDEVRGRGRVRGYRKHPWQGPALRSLLKRIRKKEDECARETKSGVWIDGDEAMRGQQGPQWCRGG